MFINMKNQPHQNKLRLQIFLETNSEILTLQPEAEFSQRYLFQVHSTTCTSLYQHVGFGIWKAHTQTQSPPTGQGSFQFVVISNRTYLLESLKIGLVLLIYTLFFHSQESFCVTLSWFSGHNIITFIPKSFLKDFLKPSTGKQPVQ